MIKTLLRLFGLAKKEYHHIVADFNKAIVDLEGLSDRKSKEAADHTEAAAELISKSNQATRDAQQAASTAEGIRNAFRLPSAA